MRDHTSQPCDEWAEMLAMIQSGNLSIEDSKALGAHLFSCSRCSDTLDDYRLIHSYMQRSLAVEPLPDLPPDFFTRPQAWKCVLHRLYRSLHAHKWPIAIGMLIGIFIFLLGWQSLLTVDIKLAVIITLAPATVVSLCIAILLKLSELRARIRMQPALHTHSSFFQRTLLKSRKDYSPLVQVDWQEAEVGSLATFSRSLAIKRQQNKRGWRDRKLLFFAILSLLVSIMALGTTLFVSSPTLVTNLRDSGPGSLRHIINIMQSGGTITFAPGLSGTLFLTSGDLYLNKNLTLDGGTGTPHINISSGTYGYKIHVAPGITISMNDLAFKGSTVRNNAFIYNEGNLTLTNSIVSDNTSYYSGGGIGNWNGALTLTNSVVSDNKANGNGGGIFNLQSRLNISNSIISNNTSYDNGGGIYNLRGTVTITGSTISSNSTKASDSQGGGIEILNGLLNLTGSTIQGNSVSGDGGGIAILGSQASINSSIISANSADQKGGGLAVENDPDNNYPGQVMITTTSLGYSPTTQYFIGNNNAPLQPDILGRTYTDGPSRSLVISENPIMTKEKLASIHASPEQSPQFLGNADINAFCRASGYKNGASLDVRTAYDSKCLLASDEPANFAFNVAKVCQWQYHQPTAIDRLADYYDPSSWQCYGHEKMLGSLVKNTDFMQTYCQHKYQGNAILNGPTAYDWKCMSQSSGLIGLSMTDACRWFYHRPNALDRLDNFNNPYSWQCWVPA